MLNNKTASFFNKSLRWNFFGSCLYEITKVFHNFYLLHYMTNTDYGQTGFILSTIYLTARIADFGNAYSTVPLLEDMRQSQRAYRFILGRFFLYPQFPALLISACVLSWYIPQIDRGLIIAIFICETYRLFLRYLLHAQFQTACVVIVELASFSIFLASVWLPYIIYGNLTPHSILIAHFADSALASISLGILSIFHYKALPESINIEKIPAIKTIVCNKLFPYFNRLNREITSSNVLTPIYAVMFGYERVSIFYFLGIATTAYQMIIKNTITYSGNALMAQLRYASNQEKAAAFNMISAKLCLMLAIPLGTIIIFYSNAIAIVDYQFINLVFCFLVLMGIDLVMHIYEQYYLIQNAGQKFFTIKLLESAACLSIFYFGSKWSIMQAFSSFIIIKLSALLFTALQAFTTWDLYLKWRATTLWLGITLAASLAIKILVHSKPW